MTGHDASGFYINDPGGDFLIAAINNYSKFINETPMVHVKYSEFYDAILSFLDLTIILGAESTLVVTSSGPVSKEGLTLNFFPGEYKTGQYNISINDLGGNNSGVLTISGQILPSGYRLTDINGNPSGFDGQDYLYVRPTITSSYLNIYKRFYLHVEIDNEKIQGSPQSIGIPVGPYVPFAMKTQLKNLRKGSHIITVELRSDNDNDPPYDYWEFPFNIDKEYFTQGSVVDIDGNIYKTVEIGTQTWMAENLKTTKLNDGTNIPEETNGTSWQSLTTPGYCWYNNDINNKNIYGGLYNWYATSTNKLCPSGWHVPSDNEWKTLESFLGGASVAGKKLKEIGTNHWTSPNTGTDEVGFTALPGGFRHNTTGFTYLNAIGVWMTSTLVSTGGRNVPWYVVIRNNADIVEHGSTSVTDGTKDGYSVRCIKD